MDGRFYKHREISYAPQDLRKKRTNLYILTDMKPIVNAGFAMQTDGIIDNLDNFSDELISNSAFYIEFSRGDIAVPFIRRIIKNNGLFAPPPDFNRKAYEAFSTHASITHNEIINALQSNYFGDRESEMQICQAVEITKDLEGDFVEIGVYSGTSALTALVHMRNIGVKRKCWLLDTYSGFNYAAAKNSSDVIWDGTHQMQPDLTIERIKNLVSNTEQEVHVVPNEICSQQLPQEITKIALAHVDVDLYDAVLAALVKIGPMVVNKGIIVLDDPSSIPGLYGAYVAMKDFLETELGKNFVCVHTTTKHFLIKTGT